MNSHYSEDQSSDLNSYRSFKETNLSRFLSRITPSLFNEMKRYLQRNKFLHEIKNHDPHKVSLYEDIYAIATLKQKETEIFTQKGKREQTLQEIANYTKRSFSTIDDRMRKKLHQLTPEQLIYYIENDKDIVFRGNSKVINTDQWPEHLKNGSRNHFNDNEESSQIYIDSESQSRLNSVPNQNRKVMKLKPQKKKFDVVQQVVRIMNQPDGDNFVSWPEPEKSFESFNEETVLKDKDLKNPIERVIFAQKVIKGWEQNNQNNYLKKEERLIVDSKIFYNFHTREYMLMNPEIMKNIFNELRKEEEIHHRKIRDKQIQQAVQRRILQNRRNHESNQRDRREKIDLIEENHEEPKNTVRKSGRNQVSPHVIQIQEENDENQLDQSANVEKNAHNLIKFLENLVQNTNLQTLPEQARKLLKEGLQIKDETKKALQRKSTQKNKQIQQSKTLQKEIKQKDIRQKYIQQTKKINVLNLISQDEESEEKSTSIPVQNSSTNKIMYWFNNDPNLYAVYQNNPYKNEYLMWSQEEDDILEKSNFNFNRYSGELEKLIKIKSAEMVKKRIDFLNIKMNNSLRFYIENISRH